MKSVLVFRSAALGDFVMAAPALQKLRENFPGREIVLLTIQTSEKSVQQLVATYAGGRTHVPWVGLVMPHLVDQVVVIENLSSWRYLWTLRQRLLAFDFEAAVLMLDPCSPWAGRMKKLMLLRFLLGFVPIYGWRGRGSIRKDVAVLKANGLLRHHVHGPLQFLSDLSPPLSYIEEELKFDLRTSADAETWVQAWMEQQGLGKQRLLALVPGSLQPHKQWPLEFFQELVLTLLQQYRDLHVVVLGTSKDRNLGDTLVAQNPERISNLAGVSSIDQSAALLKRVALLVGNDGGAMHLGDAMGCKVISLVPGIEYPDSIEPWHNKDMAVRWPVECAPCYSFTNCPQGHQRCMREIPVATVLSQCQSVL